MVSHHKHAKGELRDWVAMFDRRCLRSKNKDTKNCTLAIRYFEYKPANQCHAPDTERLPAHVESEPAPSTRVTDASAQTDVDGVMWNRMWAAYEAARVKHDLIASAAPDTLPRACNGAMAEPPAWDQDIAICDATLVAPGRLGGQTR